MVLKARAGGVSMAFILLSFCLALAAFIVRGLLDPPQINIPAAVPLSQVSADSPEHEPFKPFEVPPLDQYSEIVERPLFLETRRPPPPEIPDVAVEEEEQPVEEQVFTLLGVMVTPDSKMALVEVDESGNVARLKVGDEVEGWELDSVSADNVVLRKGESVKNLPLVRNKPPSPLKDARRRALEARKRALLRRQQRQAIRNSNRQENANAKKPQIANNRENGAKSSK